MGSVFWHLANRTAETQFIFNLFHLLLAGLTLLVLLHQQRTNRDATTRDPNRLLAAGFLLLVLHFALLTLYFGAEFFFRTELAWAGFQSFSHGLLVWGLLTVVAFHRPGELRRGHRVVSWAIPAGILVGGLVLADILFASPQLVSEGYPHSLPVLLLDLLALGGVGFGMRAVWRRRQEGTTAALAALASFGLVFLLHSAPFFVTPSIGISLWNLEQNLLSVSLFAFAWAAGERSRNLLDRVFVRLNLTFIILASLIMLITVGMEKYQYLRLAEERSMNLAEFLRGHVVYYKAQGYGLEDIFRRPEVLRRVVVEFGTLPELREVNVYLDGQRASFRTTQDWGIEEEIVSLAAVNMDETRSEQANSFQMIRLPIENGTHPENRVEFVGTMDYINEHIGKYIILIYTVFTIVVGLATGIIGMIVTDADRRLRRQYAELQETQQQLAQAAKLASVGELAGGMAHEINTPITSILSLASHMAEGKNAAEVPPKHRKSLKVIAQQAERVSKTVRNLLTFGRQSRFELGRVDVRELLEAAISLVQCRLKAQDVRLRRDFNGNLPVVLGDANRLTEVVVNLLNNAIDSMPEGGTLVVRACSEPDPDGGGGVRLEVADTGCGIAPDHLHRIFDPFFTTKEPGRGTGLGLSISHGIVKDHSGQISAYSQPGQGTTVVVTLPKGGW